MENALLYFENELIVMLCVEKTNLMVLDQREKIFLDGLVSTNLLEMLTMNERDDEHFEILMNEMKANQVYMSLLTQTETVIARQIQKLEFIKTVNARISLNKKTLIFRIMELLGSQRNMERERVLKYEDIITFTTSDVFNDLYELALRQDENIKDNGKYHVQKLMVLVEKYTCDSKRIKHDIRNCKKIHMFNDDDEETMSSMKRSVIKSIQNGSHNDLLCRLKKYMIDHFIKNELLEEIEQVEMLIYTKLLSILSNP